MTAPSGTSVLEERRRPQRQRPRRHLPLVAAAGLLAAALGVVVGASLWPSYTDTVLLREDFTDVESTYVSSQAFWNTEDKGLAENPEWFADDGMLQVRSGAAHSDDAQLRMWTRQQNLTDIRVSVDITYNGLSGGDAPWRGMSLWLNRTVCTPVPSCSAVADAQGNSGYMLRFIAADGHMVINKKIAGDTRDKYSEGATSYVQGGTYYFMDKVAWAPAVGKTYTFTGSVTSDAAGHKTIEMSVDGEPLLAVVDDGSIGGAPLEGGRVGLRGDYADIAVDNIVITRRVSRSG